MDRRVAPQKYESTWWCFVKKECQVWFILDNFSILIMSIEVLSKCITSCIYSE